jgi:hypothetical protein
MARGQEAGHGTMWYADGTAYEGGWYEDKKHGEGIDKHPSGLWMKTHNGVEAQNPEVVEHWEDISPAKKQRTADIEYIEVLMKVFKSAGTFVRFTQRVVNKVISYLPTDMPNLNGVAINIDHFKSMLEDNIFEELTVYLNLPGKGEYVDLVQEYFTHSAGEFFGQLFEGQAPCPFTQEYLDNLIKVPNRIGAWLCLLFGRLFRFLPAAAREDPQLYFSGLFSGAHFDDTHSPVILNMFPEMEERNGRAIKTIFSDAYARNGSCETVDIGKSSKFQVYEGKLGMEHLQKKADHEFVGEFVGEQMVLLHYGAQPRKGGYPGYPAETKDYCPGSHLWIDGSIFTHMSSRWKWSSSPCFLYILKCPLPIWAGIQYPTSGYQQIRVLRVLSEIHDEISSVPLCVLVLYSSMWVVESSSKSDGVHVLILRMLKPSDISAAAGGGASTAEPGGASTAYSGGRVGTSNRGEVGLHGAHVLLARRFCAFRRAVGGERAMTMSSARKPALFTGPRRTGVSL